MAILSSWQRIDRVLPGQPFGNGSDGALSSATIPTITKDYCSGNADSTTLTTNGSTFATGDIILIHQTRGTGVGQWEINRVASGGSSTPTLQTGLKYTYTTSGGSVAQATKIPQYTDVTVQSGTWTLPTWDGSTGGIVVIAANGTYTQTGAVSGFGQGYAGGTNRQDPTPGDDGEGGSGNPGSDATGAGQCPAVNSGGGGGYGTAGQDGDSAGSGGDAYGSADLTSFSYGGGGAGASANPAANAGVGGRSGGAIIIFAKTIANPGGIASVNGANGGSATDRGGGAGSGGAILIACQNATLGTNKFTATGGTGGTGTTGPEGGNGGVGRIAVHHSGTITGTTNPSFTDVTDLTLVESLGGSFLLNMI